MQPVLKQNGICRPIHLRLIDICCYYSRQCIRQRGYWVWWSVASETLCVMCVRLYFRTWTHTDIVSVCPRSEIKATRVINTKLDRSTHPVVWARPQHELILMSTAERATRLWIWELPRLHLSHWSVLLHGVSLLPAWNFFRFLFYPRSSFLDDRL